MSQVPPPSLGSHVSALVPASPAAGQARGEATGKGLRSRGSATLPARGAPVGKWWRNGCNPRAAATRKIRVVPVKAAKMAAPHAVATSCARSRCGAIGGRRGSDASTPK